MEKEANLRHWDSWAAAFATDLRATTKCLSIKRLELDAFSRRIAPLAPPVSLLEIGCGNGVNGFLLAERFPRMVYVGVDFSTRMIQAAMDLGKQRSARAELLSRMAFGVSDARQLTAPLALDSSKPSFRGPAIFSSLPELEEFDVVMTDRMLINLATPEEQLDVMARIATLVRDGGMFLMLENSLQCHRRLNALRAAVDLPERVPAEFNVFVDEERVVDPFRDHMTLEAVDDFGALHDLALYVVQAALSNGEILYDTPMMSGLTDAILEMRERGVSGSPPIGQNRLWVWRKGGGASDGS